MLDITLIIPPGPTLGLLLISPPQVGQERSSISVGRLLSGPLKGGGRGDLLSSITEAGDFITEDVDNYFEIKDEIKDYQVDDDADEKEDDDDEKEEDVLNQLLRPVTIAPPS